MQIKLAKTAGFCMGVKRALNIVLDVVNQKKNSEEIIFTYGPLIHNAQIVELLNFRGVKVLKNSSELKNYKGLPCTVIIRSHGISPQLRKELLSYDVKICDATCPKVGKVQSIIKKYNNNNYTIIIIGDKGHAEVIGLLGFSENKGIVISTQEDAENLPNFDKVCVVGQTTQDKILFDKIVNVLKAKYANLEIFDTVCDATTSHQNELKELTNISDAIIVVGGKNSANTTRLVNLASELGKPAFHVETSDEITPSMLKNYNQISITAGASTPNWIFLDVAEKVSEIQKDKMPLYKRILITLGLGVLRSNIYISFGAAALTYTSCVLQQIPPRFLYLLLTFLYIFSMNVLNQFTEQTSVGFNYPGKKKFYERHGKVLFISGILAGIGALILSIDLGHITFLLLFLATLMGIIYQVKIIPKNWLHIFKYQRLKDMPASKDIFVALGWASVIVIFPLLGTKKEFSYGSAIALFFTITIVFVRSILYGIRELQGDSIVGKETLPIILGEKKSILFIKTISISLIFLLLFFLINGWIYLKFYSLLIVPIYLLICIFFYKKIIVTRNLFDIIIDFSFILAGIMSFI